MSQCTEEKLKFVFEVFGTVTEVSIPMKEKKSMGFGFVQFEELGNAAKAHKQINGKQIMNRTVAVDWTIPRTEYLQAMQKNKESSHQEDDAGESEEEEEKEEDEEDDDVEMDTDKEEEESQVEADQDSDEEEESDVEMDGEEEEDEEEEDEDDDEEEEEDEMDNDEEEDDEEEDKGNKAGKGWGFRKPSEDVQEGKTLFIRNVPYDSTDDDIRDLFAPFGELEFARVVVDPMTEHSRGTAFVKFKRKEDADGCLHEGDAVRLNGRLLALSPAISRAEAVKLRTADKDKAKEEQKDKRNLHLLREGLIRPGTKAAEGLSEQFINKRLKIENVKKEKLKNLNIFVSPTRLAVHNLPKAVDGKKLKELAREAAGDKTARVIEARIMRDVNNPSAQGVSKSLGFGFVEFTQYEHALAALLKLNNNAELFGPDKRPIVGFSLENRRALEIQQKRRDKANMKRQAFSKNTEEEDGEEEKEEVQPRKPYSQQRLQAQQKTSAEPQVPANRDMVMPQDGKKKGLPRHFGAKNRWRDRGKVADEKRQRMKDKRLVLQKQVWNSMKTPEPAGGLKVNKKELRKEKQKNQNQKRKNTRDVREEKQFNAMVNKYKQKLTRGSETRTKGSSKWFDT
eukprot:XP_783689.3 PREDICTED: RNA-binding protein 28 [Strongylocentrotus purpuratus]